jgi:putative spermidine/putrescine transport system ATP-binding protein
VPAATLIGIRPEKIQIARPQETRAANGTNLVEGVVELVSYLGPSTEFRVRIFGDRYVLVQQPNRDASSALATGQAVELIFPPEWCFLFKSDAASEALLKTENFGLPASEAATAGAVA